MFAGQLDTPEPSIRLVRPVVERDASLSLQWLGGEHGRTTMPDGRARRPDRGANSRPREVADQQLHQSGDQYSWMIERDSSVIGSIWVDLPLIRGPRRASGVLHDWRPGSPRPRNGPSRTNGRRAVPLPPRGQRGLRPRVRLQLHKRRPADKCRARLKEPYADPDDGLRWQNFVIRHRNAAEPRPATPPSQLANPGC